MPARNLSDANEGREAACDAGRSLLPGSGFELFVGKQLHRTDSDEANARGPRTVNRVTFIYASFPYLQMRSQ
jgi:hypothetical protein